MAELLDHLQVVLHTLLDALCLQVITHLLEVVDLLGEIVLDMAHGTVGLLLCGDKEVGRIDMVVFESLQGVHGHSVAFLDAVDLVVPPSHPQDVVAVGHGDVDRVALH